MNMDKGYKGVNARNVGKETLVGRGSRTIYAQSGATSFI